MTDKMPDPTPPPEGSDRDSDAPSGKEATTEGDETLPEDQETFQPEST